MARKKEGIEHVQHHLELKEEIKLHERGWVIQRVGWGFMLLIMLAGAIGVFGNGWLSKKAPVSGPVKAEYERFFRYETEMKILVQSSTEPISTISFIQSYLKSFSIVRFVPEPLYNQSTTEDIVYFFQGGQSRVVSIYLIPKEFGSLRGVMKVNGSRVIHLNHFIYP